MNSKNIEKRYDLIRMLLAIALAMGLVLLLIVLVSSKPLEAMGYSLPVLSKTPADSLTLSKLPFRWSLPVWR